MAYWKADCPSGCGVQVGPNNLGRHYAARHSGEPVPVEEMALARWHSSYREDESGCWLWQGVMTDEGYGVFSAGDRNHPAHTWGYRRIVGPIPDGLVPDHRCRNRACVNPEHLEPVTNRENLLRGETIAAANAAKTHCAQGHEYTPDNTYRPPNRNERHCKACRRKRANAWKKATP